MILMRLLIINLIRNNMLNLIFILLYIYFILWIISLSFVGFMLLIQRKIDYRYSFLPFLILIFGIMIAQKFQVLLTNLF